MLNNRLVPLELAPLWEILDPALYADLTLYLNRDKLKEIVLCVRITYAYGVRNPVNELVHESFRAECSSCKFTPVAKCTCDVMSAQLQGDPDKRLSTTDLSSPRWSSVR